MVHLGLILEERRPVTARETIRLSARRSVMKLSKLLRPRDRHDDRRPCGLSEWKLTQLERVRPLVSDRFSGRERSPGR